MLTSSSCAARSPSSLQDDRRIVLCHIQQSHGISAMHAPADHMSSAQGLMWRSLSATLRSWAHHVQVVSTAFQASHAQSHIGCCWLLLYIPSQDTALNGKRKTACLALLLSTFSWLCLPNGRRFTNRPATSCIAVNVRQLSGSSADTVTWQQDGGSRCRTENTFCTSILLS